MMINTTSYNYIVYYLHYVNNTKALQDREKKMKNEVVIDFDSLYGQTLLIEGKCAPDEVENHFDAKFGF